MKAVILAGGLGTRISEESHLRPKPLVEIGGKPILWHIMKILSANGVQEFIICCGYKGYLIKEYFSNYFLHMADVTFDIPHNTMQVHHTFAEPWKVTVVDTGMDTMTGGRILRIQDYVRGERFLLTYGDGVSDIDVRALVRFHEDHHRLATVTAVQPTARFGALEFSGNCVSQFVEKPKGDGRWISGGFFILESGIFKYLSKDQDVWEQEPLRKLAEDGELVAYRHSGFWAAMDTLRDKTSLEEMWASKRAPWKAWE
ncbi:glucose-1-phosphate cytidylyltransferase [Steroidobacter sp. S1-65]|uniref:Glucose-1-phosphate cytidylyltransferase n=1 Tax=Steroidobacter gossypii TaxID=2805490 RepID=A0ABS1X6R1_9GAMM|nr:glucose-1-phosphate cytidylyltransferase [Steroidobacter gossypii]MBM0108912.1 glucose-1-phosphate cytidylyltransferase [Steroidobacter gossypii]